MTRIRIGVASRRGALLAAVALVLACGHGREAAPEHVPARWRVVRTSPGHLTHLGEVACTECHAAGFTRPPVDVCTRCHITVPWLHHNDATVQTPTCLDCHDFAGDPARTPWGCMRCHDKDQGHTRAIGAHADQPCSDCHAAHAWPPTSPRACLDCHPGRQTQHAGLRGCRDCHTVHEASGAMQASMDLAPRRAGAGALCERCHAAQPGRLRVDAHALTTGHPACTACHVPHSQRGVAPRPCADCHRDQPVLAASKHSCTGCHDPHGGAARPCTTCHREQVAHPDPKRSPLGSCVGCHPPHDRSLAAATAAAAPHGSPGLACATCHSQPGHATTRCLDCHTAHGGRPARDAGSCTRCHAGPARGVAGTGHAQCTTCHTSDIHGPQARPPSCATCHAGEAASTSTGHADCARCHQPHAPRPSTTCAGCHAQAAAAGHGPRVACTSCHRAHGPRGVARPPACQSCHALATLAGLHQSPKHRDCAGCHRAHELRPADDRATCTACHKDRVGHEPGAARCAACHPFR